MDKQSAHMLADSWRRAQPYCRHQKAPALPFVYLKGNAGVNKR